MEAPRPTPLAGTESARRRRARVPSLPVSLAVAGLLLAPVAGEQTTVKLNDTLARPITGRIERVLFGTSGTHAVYLAPQEHVGKSELYGVPLDGSAPAVKLNPPLPDGLEVGHAFDVSRDGSRVAFAIGTATLASLWTAPTDGSAPPLRLLQGLTVPYLSALKPRLSPDGARVLFLDPMTRDSLWSARTDAGALPVRLHSGTVVTSFEISPDGSRVVLADAAGALRSVPIDRSTEPVVLSGSVVAGGAVAFHAVTPIPRASCTWRTTPWTRCSSSTRCRSTAALPRSA
jgi:hypothetical protein